MVLVVKTVEEFDEQIQRAGNLLVVVDFFATWCGPCVSIAPILKDYAKQYSGKIVVLKVDVDESEILVDKYSIESMPTFLFIKNGTIQYRFEGADEDDLKNSIEKYI